MLIQERRKRRTRFLSDEDKKRIELNRLKTLAIQNVRRREQLIRNEILACNEIDWERKRTTSFLSDEEKKRIELNRLKSIAIQNVRRREQLIRHEMLACNEIDWD